MIAIPAVDIREGACVQLVGGSYERERIRLRDPVEVARRWFEVGFSRLHVVDLDAATGRGDNADVIDAILSETGAAVQVGGGVRTTERLDDLIADGAECVVVGTRALEDPGWLEENAARHPGRLIVAMDVRGGAVVARGWTSSAGTISSTIELMNALPLAGILVTAVDVEGQEGGPDLKLVDDVMSSASLQVIASGGITSIADLRALESRGVSAAVVGMALYTGTMNAATAAKEFGS